MATDWTQADAEYVKSKILILVGGAQVVQVTFGEETVRFNQSDLPALWKLHEMILTSIQAADSTGDYFLTRTEKGL